MTISNGMISFRPNKWQYVAVRPDLQTIDRLVIRLGNENGENISISKDGFGETRISIHICSENYLKGG